MRWPFEMASAIGALVIAGCTIHYFTTVFLWPEYVAAQDDEEQDRRRTLLGNWLYYGYLIAAFIGTAFCIYQGVAAVLRWMPQSWVNFVVDESDRKGLEFSFASLMAFFGALALLTGLSKLSSWIVNERVEVERLRGALDEARQSKQQLPSDR